MTKRKDSVALFEVINKGKANRADGPLNVPGWIDKDAPGAPAAAADAAAPQAGAAPEPPELDDSQRLIPPEPAFSFDGERVRLSLNTLGAGAVALGLIVILGGVFALGRMSGKTAKPPEQTLSERVQIKPGVAPAGGKEPSAASITSTDQQQPGLHYLVIQGGIKLDDKGKKEAFDICEFCKEHGKPCTVNKLGNYYIVWSLTGFPDSRSDNARNFAKEIEQLGKQFQAAGGRYDFNQKKSGQFDPFFLKG